MLRSVDLRQLHARWKFHRNRLTLLRATNGTNRWKIAVFRDFSPVINCNKPCSASIDFDETFSVYVDHNTNPQDVVFKFSLRAQVKQSGKKWDCSYLFRNPDRNAKFFRNFLLQFIQKTNSSNFSKQKLHV